MPEKVPEDFEDMLRFMVRNTPDELPPRPSKPPTKADLRRRFRIVETTAPDGERRWRMLRSRAKRMLVSNLAATFDFFQPVGGFSNG